MITTCIHAHRSTVTFPPVSVLAQAPFSAQAELKTLQRSVATVEALLKQKKCVELCTPGRHRCWALKRDANRAKMTDRPSCEWDGQGEHLCNNNCGSCLVSLLRVFYVLLDLGECSVHFLLALVPSCVSCSLGLRPFC